MKHWPSIFCLASCCFLWACRREASIPSDSFRLTVQDVISDTDVRVSLLTIRLSQAASISIDGSDGSHRGLTLPDAPEGVVREGQVSLSAARVAPAQEKIVYIQTLIQAHATNAANQFGGAGVYPVPTDTRLASFFSIPVVSGIYKLDTPVIIAQVKGKPVTLVVGKPTK